MLNHPEHGDRRGEPGGDGAGPPCCWWRGVWGLPATLLIAAVRVYQYLISPLLGQRCRFYPSCSNYFIEAVRKHGAVRGSLRGVWRILRCNPWNPGGIDPP
jgi:putative membrane protein insertion efficiency factor